MKIAILDDDPLILDLLRVYFSRRGHDVFAFPNPTEFLCKAKHPETVCKSREIPCVDMILSDVNMPYINGIDFFAGQLKKGCRCRHIALMSGAWQKFDMENASALGLKCFEKPLDFRQITEWLKHVSN